MPRMEGNMKFGNNLQFTPYEPVMNRIATARSSRRINLELKVGV